MAGPRGTKQARGRGKGGDNKRRRGGTGRGTTGGRGDDRCSQAGAEASTENAVSFDRPEPFTKLSAVNYSVLNLDDATTAHRTWRMTIFKYRLWCFNTTDKRFRFGHDDRLSCMLPEAGNFLIYVHFHGNWMCNVIDCPTGYLTGFITRSLAKDKRIQENQTKIPNALSKEKQKEIRSQLPKYIEHADMLPWSGNYVYADKCLLGYMGLQNAFTIMYRHLEGLQIFDDADVTKAGEHFIVHIPEAGRSDLLFQKIDTSFIDGVNRMGTDLLLDARLWSGRTRQAFGIMVESPDRWNLKKHEKSAEHEIKGVEEKLFGPEVKKQLLIIEDLRLYYREYPNIRRFSLKDLPVDLGPRGPVNDKLNGLLDLGSEDFTHVLIKPFPKFQRAVNDNTTSRKNRGDESLVEDNTESSFDNHNAKSNMINEVDKLSDSPDTQQFTYGCNVSADGMLPKYKKAEEKRGSAGLMNSGNACFANSVLQYLHCIPELKAALVRHLEEAMNDELLDPASMELTKAVCDLFGLLDHSAEAVSSENFLKKLEEKHSMYLEREWGIRRQQDAGEFLLLLMGTLSETLITKGDDLMNMLFGVDLFSGSETLSVKHLNCKITPEVNGLLEGLALDLQGQNSSINKLPRYLIINLERVKLDEMTCQAVKNFGKLDYPHQLNVYQLCSDELKHELEENIKVSGSDLDDYLSSDIDKADVSITKEHLTSTYDLIALVTHKGQSATAGHYIALVKEDENEWIQFDDAIKTTLDKDEVLKFTGGGNVQMAYICLYKARMA